MSSSASSSKLAVVGGGISGAACARRLAAAGFSVQVFDKARGCGGRLATRRLEWLDAAGRQRTVKLDHGAPAFAACSSEFRQFLSKAGQAGLMASWRPRLAAGSRPLEPGSAWYLPTPDMPSLCRWLLRGIPVCGSVSVDRLRPGPEGWKLESAGEALPGTFDAVVLALPPAQAAPLLAAHRSDWAQRASLALMQPCWTLMGVAGRPAGMLDWDLGRPDQGPLAWVLRNDTKVGREASRDEAHWVLHARSGWSRHHLEQSADWVQARMQAALHEWLGEPVEWRHAVVHRWRYAMPQASGAPAARRCWWDGPRRLGVCGDFLGGSGVEGAWLSAQALSDALLQAGSSAIPGSDAARVSRPARRALA